MTNGKFGRLLTACGLAATVLLGAGSPAAAQQRAKNVILFLGDAGGLSTLNAAGIAAYDKPQSLYIQSMPNIGLSDTSALNNWVTDSAAGMTAIMTGHKTVNGMVSMTPVAGGEAVEVRSLLEMAEQRGMRTGVITNMPIWDATPAACYAHAGKRAEHATILDQLVKPRFGDGVDIVIGKGRPEVDAWAAAKGSTAQAQLTAAGYKWFDDPAAIDPAAPRAASIIGGPHFAPLPVVTKAIKSLSGERGYFLMVEWDMHADDLRTALRRVREMDDMIRGVAGAVGDDTLIVFTADHSFGLRMRGGDRASPYTAQLQAKGFAQDYTPDNKLIAVDDSHTGEEVVIAARGPGAERVHGFMSNTALFDVMRRALGL